ncbi:MAG: hypothetical protein LH609_17965 [Rudanella sp.]|nr:hypothetical protein [Rudanella sp.]
MLPYLVLPDVLSIGCATHPRLMIVYRLIRERYQTTPLSAAGADRVPSAIVPISANYLLHTANVSFAEQVHMLDIIPCRLDNRLR